LTEKLFCRIVKADIFKIKTEGGNIMATKKVVKKAAPKKAATKKAPAKKAAPKKAATKK
jgi:ferredoxin